MALRVDTLYLNLVSRILTEGENKTSRGGSISPTKSVFGHSMSFDLREEFPILSSKRINFDNVSAELTWFIRGETNINTLRAPQIWAPWADENGECGPIYGYQWRNFKKSDGTGVDQLKELIHLLKNSPDSRRMVVTAWNPADLEHMALPPCHMSFQCYTVNGYLDLQVYQRSVDVPVGLPYNLASYALLTHMLAHESGLIPRYLHHVSGDAHIYDNQRSGIERQLSRLADAVQRPLPKLTLPQHKSIWSLAGDDFPEDFKLTGYKPMGFIKFPVEV